MLILILKIAGFVSAFIVLHILALFAGIYDGKTWADIPLHFLGGMVLGVIWLWIVDYNKRTRENYSQDSLLIFGFAMVGWVMAWALVWEILEYLFQDWLGVYARFFRFYSPNLPDALSDLLLGLIGGLMVLFYHLYRTYKK